MLPRVPLTLFLLLPLCALAQSPSEDIAALIEEYRQDRRGPYRGIFWFCSNGSRRAARDPCPNDRRAVQHADYKPAVKRLMRDEHLFIAPILAGTGYSDFWDAENDHSRLKQYQLNTYLVGIDDGWVLERARYYRGAFQVEDEEAWGQRFLDWLLSKDEVLAHHYYLIAQAARDIPHGTENDLNQRIRDLSRRIADAYEPFMDLRVKIHGRPAVEDAAAVRAFAERHEAELSRRNLSAETRQLADDIQEAYGGTGFTRLAALLDELPDSDPASTRVRALIEQQQQAGSISRLTAAAELSRELRASLAQDERDSKLRLTLIDINNELGDIVFRTAGDWEPTTAREQMEKICYLGQAASGAGVVELWEQEEGGTLLGDPNYRYIHPWMLDEYLDNARRYVEWGAATNRATYGEVVERYAAFEPLAMGFLDDRVRRSVLLPLGQAVAALGDWLARNSDSKNRLLDATDAAQARGLNPGVARGRLHVIEGSADELEVNKQDVYVFSRPPSDLKPVGGILSVSEGNMVSHVQLLARNLGLPNAVITDDQFAGLRAANGREVFYAVSPGGTVVLKATDAMTDEERALFAVAEDDDERGRTTVPVDELDLSTRRVLNMREVDSEDSGVRCGPKAANLGQLKQLFPDKVVEGLIIPFGIFRAHLDQRMPGLAGGTTYWQYLNEGFARADEMGRQGRSAAEVEAYTLEHLSTLREAILKIELQPVLIGELLADFKEVLGGRFGEVPVFLRSDTNMEDLPQFTGAGLNKTVFNVVDREAILTGIREVWASPYTERSYRWRQRYLENPENVFPSILIIPSVDVDYSGVMITKGVSSGNEEDITVAFSRGAGGAVDGQAAEAYLLDSRGRFLLQAPARERMHRRLPASGGSVMVASSFANRILSRQNLNDLYALSREVERVMPQAPGVETEGPFDVELGFQDDKMYLFQIRPFVENERAQGSQYLRNLDPPRREGVYIDLGSTL